MDLFSEVKHRLSISRHPSGLHTRGMAGLYLVGAGAGLSGPLPRESVEWPVIPEAGISSKFQKEPDVTWLPAQLLQAQIDPWSPT